MKRRKFLKCSFLSGGSLTTTLALQTQPAKALSFTVEAFFLIGLLLRSMGISPKSSFQTIGQERVNKFPDVINKKLLELGSNSVEVIELNNRFYQYIIVERKDIDIAISFITTLRDGAITFGSPAVAGMAIASAYLRDNEKFSHEQVQKAILPTFKNQDSIASWNHLFSSTSYETIASQEGVSITYRLRKPGRGGYGDLDIVVDADRIIRVPTVRVNFSTYG